MRVASIRVRNYKRFTDLLIEDIPKTAKLVVVVGPNGCGKSSLFDAFLAWYRLRVGFGHDGDMLYHRKDAAETFGWNDNVDVTLHDNANPAKGSLYVRTAHRNDPDFTIDAIARLTTPSEHLRIGRVIENDQAVSENYRRLIYQTMAGVYDKSNDSKKVEHLRQELIGGVRESMRNVFGDLLLNNISDPLGNGAFFFEKGASKSYHYKNLSGGEKAAFDLILDLHVKKQFFQDAIYCVDEMETHLHTRVQGLLLKEMAAILPDQSQLWVTTHSLGVLRAAQEMMSTSADSVCLIDFDGIDPDIPHKLRPSNLGRVTYEKLLSIALDDLSVRVAPKTIVICEGSMTGNRRKDFDAEIYNRILGAKYPDVLFVSGGSSNQVQASGVNVAQALGRVLPGTTIRSLVDRDDRSDEEVRRLEQQNQLVLGLRNLESYLFADEVLDALLLRENKVLMRAQVLQIKADAINASISRGNSADDLKSAAGDIYTNVKQLLGIQRCGNNTEAFMRDTIAPLITDTMETFRDLKRAIIDKL